MLAAKPSIHKTMARTNSAADASIGFLGGIQGPSNSERDFPGNNACFPFSFRGRPAARQGLT
jgi:hypothetical protein